MYLLFLTFKNGDQIRMYADNELLLKILKRVGTMHYSPKYPNSWDLSELLTVSIFFDPPPAPPD